MLDNILDLVKGPIGDIITKNADIPANKKSQTASTAASSFVDGLMKYAGDGAGLQSLLGGGSASNSISKGIQDTIAASLGSKVGLKPALSKQIAAAVVPAVTALLSKKGKSGGLDLGSLLGSLAGGKSGSSAGNLINMVGGILGKKK